MLKVALVTGGARRIGASMVRAFHQAGYAVLIHCHRSMDEALALSVELNAILQDSARVVPQDLLMLEALPGWIQYCIEWKGQLDVVVNNASLFFQTKDPFDMLEFDAMWGVHVKAPWVLSHAAYETLSMCQGSIINVTDIHAERPLKGYALYSQTKAALEMQTKALAKAFAPTVRVNAIAPGPTLWPEGKESLTIAQKENILNKTPLNIHGEPHWIAQAALFLANNRAITGQSLKIEGGRLL